jgi:hypothetical protein
MPALLKNKLIKKSIRTQPADFVIALAELKNMSAAFLENQKSRKKLLKNMKKIPQLS